MGEETTAEVTEFLEMFFALYPTATEKELSYLCGADVNVKVNVSVEYLDDQTKATQISQYELILCKKGNWKIIN